MIPKIVKATKKFEILFVKTGLLSMISLLYFIAETLVQKIALIFLCFFNKQIQVNRRDVFHINFKVREPFSM